MAVLYVTECYAPHLVAGNMLPAVEMPPIAEQVVAIGGTSTASSAFNTLTKVVRLHTDAICSVAFGADPTATTSTMRLSAGSTEYFEVTPGQKVAVITNT